MKAKAERGERVSTQIPYGYKKDPDVKGHLLIDEETAPTVRRIFELCAQVIGPTNIGNVLRDEKIFKPTIRRYHEQGIYGTVTDTDKPYGWTAETIGKILKNEVYLGHTVNCRTRIISYKDKRQVDIPKSEQYRFENTHEAIIDQETWDAVQKVCEGKRRRNNMGDTNLQALTPEILRTFIDKVVIHERTEKWSKTAEQQIDIYFRYVGCIVPESVD